jgi:hypothetical protein
MSNNKQSNRKHKDSVNCFFCGRDIKYKYDIISTEELYNLWGIIKYESVCMCATCQHLYEEQQEEKELDRIRQEDGYDYYWEVSNP